MTDLFTSVELNITMLNWKRNGKEENATIKLTKLEEKQSKNILIFSTSSWFGELLTWAYIWTLTIIGVILFMLVLPTTLCVDAELKKVSEIHMFGDIGKLTHEDLTLVNFQSMKPKIDEAFAKDNVEVVLLQITSNGGSFKESVMIHDYIRLKTIESGSKINVVSFIKYLGVSGGYLIACAGSQIFIHDNDTRAGSIGAISNLTTIPGEEIYYVSGKYKAPDLRRVIPQTSTELYFQLVTETGHLEFVSRVLASRKQRLHIDEYVLEGKIYQGQEAVKAELVDGMASPKQWFQEKLKKNCYYSYLLLDWLITLLKAEE